MNIDEMRKYNEMYEEEQKMKKELEEKALENVLAIIKDELNKYLENETNGIFAKMKETALKGGGSMQENIYAYRDRLEIEDLKIYYSMDAETFKYNGEFKITHFVTEILREYFEKNGFTFTEKGDSDTNRWGDITNGIYRLQIVYIKWN